MRGTVAVEFSVAFGVAVDHDTVAVAVAVALTHRKEMVKTLR